MKTINMRARRVSITAVISSGALSVNTNKKTKKNILSYTTIFDGRAIPSPFTYHLCTRKLYTYLQLKSIFTPYII